MDDLRYYRRRVTEEQIAALESQDVRVKRVHTEMAGRYRDIVRTRAFRGIGDLRSAFGGRSLESRTPALDHNSWILPLRIARS